MDLLLDIFPETERSILQSCLDGVSGDVEAAVQQLLTLPATSSADPSEASTSSDQQQLTNLALLYPSCSQTQIGLALKEAGGDDEIAAAVLASQGAATSSAALGGPRLREQQQRVSSKQSRRARRVQRGGAKGPAVRATRGWQPVHSEAVEVARHAHTLPEANRPSAAASTAAVAAEFPGLSVERSVSEVATAIASSHNTTTEANLPLAALAESYVAVDIGLLAAVLESCDNDVATACSMLEDLVPDLVATSEAVHKVRKQDSAAKRRQQALRWRTAPSTSLAHQKLLAGGVLRYGGGSAGTEVRSVVGPAPPPTSDPQTRLAHAVDGIIRTGPGSGADRLSYEEARRGAADVRAKVGQMYRRANEAYRAKQYAVAGALAAEARLLARSAATEDDAAAAALVATNSGSAVSDGALHGSVLDLHGLHVTEATAAVRRAIETSLRLRHSTLVIVTGRGAHSHKRKPVVLPAVAKLLRQSPMVRDVQGSEATGVFRVKLVL